MLRKIVSEPLIHFVVIAVIIHALSVGSVQSADQTEIIIDPQHVARIREEYRHQVGSEPSEAILDTLIESTVQEEILYREGLALSLGQEDIIVRRRIVQKMEFLLQESAPQQAVTDDVLGQLYEAYKTRLAEEIRVSLTHRFFPDVATDGRAEADRQLKTLAMAGCEDGVGVGSAWGGRTEIHLASRADLGSEFGHSDLVVAALDVPLSGWQGPFKSTYGWHLICVRDRPAPTVQPLTLVRDRLVSEYQVTLRQTQFDAAMDLLRSKYQVVLRDQ